MSFNTTTRFAWIAYTKRWLIRCFAVGVGCSLLIGASVAFGWLGVVIASVVSVSIAGGVLLWTVAEMVEDGLPNDGSATE